MQWNRLAALAALSIAPAFAQDTPESPPPAADAPAPSEAAATAEQPLPTVPVDENKEAAPAAKERVTLDTVEVTAQRRTQRLLDVPVAVTAITQDQVQARGIGRLDDLNSLAPGLQVSRSPSNTTISQLTIRGSSQINPAIYWDPAVGVYLDGVYIGKGQGAIFDIVDLQSIEVLRGPQGTLYGRNTIAGTINFVTREPSGTLNGTGAIEYGTFNDRILHASMDLPEMGMARLTFGVRKETRDPWISTTATSPVDGMNDRNNQGAHLGALLSLTDDLEAMYHLDYSKTDQTNNFLQLYRYTEDPNTCNPCMTPYVAKHRRDTADINAPSVERADITGHSLIVTWQVLDGLTLKSISGYRDVQWLDQLDLDGSPNDIAHSMRDTTYDQKSQDLNLSGQFDTVHFTLGAYYFADNGFTNNPIHVQISGANIEFDSRYGTHAKAWAGYGQADWTLFERLTLAGGARYTTEKKDLDRVFGFTSGNPPLPQPPYTYYMPEGYKAPGATFTATTPMASVAWRFSDSLNAYLRYAEGFKSGGFNGEYSNIQSTDPINEHERETNTPFLPEKQKSLEAGLKSSWLDGKALVNVAAFQNKLDNLQVSIFTASGAAASVIRNAGRATVRGFEIEAAFIPFDGTSVRANYASLDPVYDEFIDAVCSYDRTTDQVDNTKCADENVADNRAFVHAPKSSWNLVVDGDLWATGWGTLHATADYAWTDSFYTYPYQLTYLEAPDCGGTDGGPRPCYDGSKQSAPFSQVPAYAVLNAKLGLVGIPFGGARTGELVLWGRNVLDEDSVNNFIDFGPGFSDLTVVNFVEPASYGLAGILHF